MEEVWKPVVGFEEAYEVSDLGRVRSIDRVDARGNSRTGRMLTNQRLSKRGYYLISFCKNGQQKTMSLHRVVAMAHIHNPDNKPFVNHKNEDTTDCRASNLEWVYPRENVSYSSKQSASRFVGVTKAYKNRWQARIVVDGVRHWLGYFKTEEEAHKAYVNALSTHNVRNKYATAPC